MEATGEISVVFAKAHSFINRSVNYKDQIQVAKMAHGWADSPLGSERNHAGSILKTGKRCDTEAKSSTVAPPGTSMNWRANPSRS